MYLISIYFDGKSNNTINGYINKVARTTGNTFMTDNKVPPHITIAAFDTMNENEAIKIFHEASNNFEKGKIKWVTVGSFGQSVIYIAPVLNEYLHSLSWQVHEQLIKMQNIRIDGRYQPFSWLPHATIGKTMNNEQQKIAFNTMQKYFTVFESEVIRIGLAKTNPYREFK